MEDSTPIIRGTPTGPIIRNSRLGLVHLHSISSGTGYATITANGQEEAIGARMGTDYIVVEAPIHYSDQIEGSLEELMDSDESYDGWIDGAEFSPLSNIKNTWVKFHIFF